MADIYTTEAIACGLSDVAGWLENEGGRDKHARTIRLGVERLRELGAAVTDTQGEKPRDRIASVRLVPWEPDSQGGALVTFDSGFKVAVPLYPLEGSARVTVTPAAPSHPGEADRVGLGELERLSAEAGHLEEAWRQRSTTGLGRRHIKSGLNVIAECDPAVAAYIVALVNAYRAGHLVPASLAALGTGEGSGGASFGPDHSASPSPSVSALTGECSSRGEVDYDDLNRLFALMPEGPWHPLRTGGGHEIRQIDTDPTNKHHWPFRLCQSIAGQRAGCDDAVFAFIAGVLNAWPAIAAANSDDAYIERVLAMPEDELRKRFLADGQSPEQAATISRQAFDLAVLKVALTQIHDQYIINSGDMTDAEALSAIKKIAARALGTEAEGQDAEGGLVHEGPAPQGATPSPLPHPQAPNTLSEVEKARALLEKEKRAYNGNPSEIVKYLHWRADLVGDEPETRLDLLSRADAIEAAIATLRASQEQDSKVRDV